jgi:hypothetical protein
MHSRRPHVPIALLAICAISLTTAACGSSSPSSTSASSPDGGNPTQAQAQQEMVSFSDCMRSHDVPSFPDPSTTGFKAALAPSTPRSPAFQSAYQICQHLLPGGGPAEEAARHRAQLPAFLAFVRCLRSHGFLSFPDPTSSGQLTHEMVAAAGINLHQPAVLQAGDACASVTHGVIAKADVARFVAGQ